MIQLSSIKCNEGYKLVHVRNRCRIVWICEEYTCYLYGFFPVLPGGRGHRQITQNRPYKKIICGEKLMAVKVAVSGNKVL